MKAVTISGTRATLVADRPIPSPRPDQLLVKVHAVALNPTDWKNIAAGAAGEGSISGCDYAGEVVQIGSAVNKDFTIGQRVAGVVHGANYSNIDDGAFAEYAVVKADLQMRIPDSLPYEKAATLGLGLST
jgi:NADPH:quinone reductase-like Zn-dependent oxidoreductase